MMSVSDDIVLTRMQTAFLCVLGSKPESSSSKVYHQLKNELGTDVLRPSYFRMTTWMVDKGLISRRKEDGGRNYLRLTKAGKKKLAQELKFLNSLIEIAN